MAIVIPRRFREKPIFTIALVVINIVMFFWTYVFANPLFFEFDLHVDHMGFVPAEFFHGKELYTIITSMFLHGDVLHIFYNMLYFFLFSVDVEAALGKPTYISLYFLSGICANLLYGLVASVFGSPLIPTIGASGAIFGIMGAYLVLFPHNEAYLMYRYIIRTRAYVAIIFYIITEIILGIFVFTDGVAHWAHIGGFFGAVVFIMLYRVIRRDRYDDIRSNRY